MYNESLVFEVSLNTPSNRRRVLLRELLATRGHHSDASSLVFWYWASMLNQSRSFVSNFRPPRKRVRWSWPFSPRGRRLAFEFLENRTLLTCTSNDVCVDFEFVDPSDVGTPLTEIGVGQDVLMNVFIQDNRTIPFGIQQAYFDMTYDASLVSANGAISHGMKYTTREFGDASVPGVVDAAGGFSTGLPLPAANSFLLFTLPLTADMVGTLTFTAQPDDNPFNEVEFFDEIGAVDDIGYTGNTIEIVNAQISITPTSGLNTTESGGTDTFEVVLAMQPSADVTIGLSSSDTSEGTVSTSSVMFTTSNWDTPQVITVTGVNDDVDDGDRGYSIITAPAVSSDSDFGGVDAPDISVTNADDDDAGIVVNPIGGLTTTEAGGTANFTIVLTSEPTSSVSIDLESSQTAEGILTASSVTFTSQNWDTPQTVTVTGQDDYVDDGDVNYTIFTLAASSSDTNYSGASSDNVILSNTDDDIAGISVIAAPNLMTAENGSTAMFQIVLDSEPTGDVTIGLSSSDPTEGTLSTGTVTFTPGNWDTPQTVTVTGQNDDVDDDDASYSVVTAAATSSDPNYGGLDAQDVSLVNIDDDTAGITVTPTLNLVTTEGGGADTLDIRLNSEPTAPVTIVISSSNTDEGTVSTSSAMFTPLNWDSVQTITVTGQDDDVSDGDIGYTILTDPATSTDLKYQGFNAADASVTNQDDDVVGIEVTPINGLVTTEAGGQATFNVVLTSQPTASVTIGVSSGDTGEGTTSVSSLIFTTGNWDSPQSVTVTGQNDDVDDGDVSYTIVTAPATSGDLSYNGFNADDVSLSNTDDDMAGIDVSHFADLTTTEAGGTVSFDIVLTSEPTSGVTIGVTSSQPGEGTPSISSVMFNASNWDTPQTVVVTGQNDDFDDGDMPYNIVTAAATSSDLLYNTLNAADVPIINRDDDTAGVEVTPTTGLATTEAGETADFTIVLTSEPAADVVIGLSTSDDTEGNIAIDNVTFTSGNWDIPQTVTVTGADDSVPDGDVTYTIITAAAASADTNYSGSDVDDVSLINLDNDVPGITVIQLANLMTTEAGGTASFTIVLDSQPQNDVTIGLSTSNPDEGTLSASSVMFTNANWDSPQTVTVTGQDDFVDDGDIAYTIITAAATSIDTDYSGMEVDDVSLTNVDDDTAGIRVSPLSGLMTTDQGATATITIVLDSQPTSEVTVGVSSSNTGEGTVTTSSVSFDDGNWDTPQDIIVTGVNDPATDGDVVYMIIFDPASSSDPLYDTVDPADVSVTNVDDDFPGVTVNPVNGLETTEAGGTAMFSMVLNTQPSEEVTIGLTSNDPGEGTISVNSVTFTPGNWDTAQILTVTGQNDDVDDGDVGYMIITSTTTSLQTAYNGLNVADVSLANINDDVAGIDVSPSSGLMTTEAGDTASFSIVLTSEPTGPVTIGLSSNNTAEGTVSQNSVAFDASNWDTPQTVVVTGQDDDVDDGDVAYSIITAPAASTDTNYNSLDATDVSVTNSNDDIAGILVSPTGGLVTSEEGGAATFTIVLQSEPTAPVTIGLSSTDTTEGTASVSSVTFTAENWNAPQTVTVTGQDDPIPDGDMPYSIVTAAATSTDSQYNGMDPDDVSLSNTDDDDPGIRIRATSDPTTTEAGGTATFAIELDTQPSDNVTINLSSSNPDEGTVLPVSVTFTPPDWNVPQTVTATGADDQVDDGNIVYTIVTAPAISADTDYLDMDADDMELTNLNDDTAGITVSPTDGLITSENLGTAAFTIVLDTQPLADVTIGLSSSDLGEGTLSETDVTFTPSNWDTPREITVTGVDDVVVDNNVAYMVITDPASSTDDAYNGLDPQDVSVTNVDNDIPGITVIPVGSQVTTEAGGEATFSVVLNTQPLADVTIQLTTSDATEGDVQQSSITFTENNWDIAQTVAVTGQNDDVDDGDVAYTIVTTASSTDTNYDGLEVADVSQTNSDDDTAGIDVTPTSGLMTTEMGGEATFTVVLNSEPTAEVTVGLSSDTASEGIVSPTSLTFDALNWNIPQTVTATGQDDDVDDGDVDYTIVVAPATSSDPGYAGIDGDDVAVSNVDDDTAEIVVSPILGLTTSESGGMAIFTIVLGAQPTADVTIGLSSSNGAEGTADASSVIFTSSNWNLPQTVTITGQDDPDNDGDMPYSIVTAAAVSNDSSYDGMDPDDVSATNTDDDDPGITVTPTAGLATTEAGGEATFTIELDTRPTADVTIDLTSSIPDEGTISTANVTFTPSNWDQPQTVTVTGQDEFVDDGDQNFIVITGAAVSVDLDYNGLDALDVAATNADDDIAGVNIVPVVGTTTSEDGSAVEFDVSLTSQPTAPVILGLSSDDAGEGTVSTASLTFTPADWDVPQRISVMGTDDAVVDGDVSYMITTAAAVSSDLAYDGLDSDDIGLTNTDNDSASVSIMLADTILDEGTSGGTTEFIFTVSLTGAVEGGFSLDYTTNDATATVADGDYVDNDGVLGFDGDDGESQLITVSVNHDAKVEIDEQFDVLLGALSNVSLSVAANISVDANPAVATIANDDSSQITVNGSANSEGNVGETTQFVFEVTLSNPVQGGFNLAFMTDDGTATQGDADYLNNDGSLTFVGTAGETQTISVQVNGDNKVERSEEFSVVLGSLSQLADPAFAQSISVAGSPATGTITNDDVATVEFANATSTVIEVTGSHSIDVRLSIPGGGTLDEEVTFSVVDALTGSAVTPGDFTLSTTSVTFAAGSSDGETQSVSFTIADDQTLEDDETVDVRVESGSNNIGGEVSTGSPAEHTVTIIDDPMTARLSGTVWIDGNLDGQRSASEAVVPGVTIELAGTDSRGQTVALTTLTDMDGSYEFIDLAGGTYTITQQHPIALNDGQESLGTIGGVEAGQVMDDQFIDIPLGPAEVGVNYDFGEAGVQAQFVNARFFLASVQNVATMLQQTIAVAQDLANNGSQTQTIVAGPPSSISAGPTGGDAVFETLLVMPPTVVSESTIDGSDFLAATQPPPDISVSPNNSTVVVRAEGSTLAVTPLSVLPSLPAMTASTAVQQAGVTSVFSRMFRERVGSRSASTAAAESVEHTHDEWHSSDVAQSPAEEMPVTDDDWMLAVVVTEETNSQLGRRAIEVALAEEENWVPHFE